MRNFLKNKVYSIINIGGLSLSFTACLFIFLYTQDELSFDRFHEDADRIHRISLTLKFSDLDVFIPMSSAPLGQAMVAQIPEVQESVRLYGLDVNHSFRIEDKAFTEKRVLYADSNFFSLFGFNLLTGNPKTVLSEPGSVVATPALAQKYFGTTSVVGKLLSVDGETFTITGLADSPPSNSHIVFDALISMSSFKPASSHSWMGNRFMTYVKLIEGAGPKTVDKKLDDLVIQNIGPDLENSLGISLQQFLQQKNKIGYDLHPIVDSHLYSKFPRDITPAGDITYIYIFVAVGIALLLISCFNFMNLSTAQFASQVKGISIRRSLGAIRSQLVLNYFKQSLILSLSAAAIGMVTVYFLLPFGNEISGKSFDSNAVFSSSFIIASLAIALFAGTLSASYPALYLTSFNPTIALRGKTNTSPKSEHIRRGLVAFQYIISICTITFTIIIFRQLAYIKEQNLGFNKEGIVVLRNIDRIGSNATPLKNALLNETGIEAASFTDRLIFEKMSGEAVRVPNNSQSHIMNFYVSDEDQLKVMGCKIIDGRFFSKDFISDSNAVVINEAAMRDLGWTSVESKELAADADTRYKVIGVVNDFNYESLRSEIKPLLIFYNLLPGNTLNIRFNGNPNLMVELLEKNWKKYGNGEPFDYSFLDQDFDALFKSEGRIGKLLSFFTVGIIIVACLGLFALSSFTVEKRASEIGVRKVLGASAGNVAFLFIFQFVRLIFISFTIAIIPTYLLSKLWLQGFAFRDELSLGPFLSAGFLVLAISIITIIYHSIKAANLNPAKTLKSE